MTSNKKEIKINPDLFVMRGAKKRNARRTAKVHTPRSLKAGSIKKALMRKIKSNHSRSKTGQGGGGSPAYVDDLLTSSLKYLSNISSSNDMIPVNLDIPGQIAAEKASTDTTRISAHGSVTLPPPPYGCLKGGNKSTYRQWKQTQKNRVGMDPPTETIQILPGPPPDVAFSGGGGASLVDVPVVPPPRISIPDALVSAADGAGGAGAGAGGGGTSTRGAGMGGGDMPRKIKLQEAKDRYKSQQKTSEKQYATFGKHKGGKNKTAKKISVLIKDSKTLKKVEHEKNMLGGHAMPKVRTYLKNRGLIKVGTTAPDEVIKELYKNAYLAGDIHNKSSDVLLHNYMAGDE